VRLSFYYGVIMILKLIKLSYEQDEYGDLWRPYITMFYKGGYKHCFAKIYSHDIKSEGFAENDNNRFDKQINSRQSIEEVMNKLRQIPISDKEDMISAMLEMIQLTEGHDDYKELLP